MSSTVKITYTNRSMNVDLPKIFVFTKNEIPSFDSLRDGIAWKVIDRIGRESSCQFDFPTLTEVCAAWNNGECKTNKLPINIGDNYSVVGDDTGIVLTKDGSACNTRSIDVCNNIHVKNGVSVQLYKEGRLLATKKTVGYDQKATFVLHPKLYWGVASEIEEGQELSSAVLNSHSFFELNLEGVSEVKLGLYGNSEDGYQFKVEEEF